MSLPYLPLKEKQAALGMVAPKANWLGKDCGLLHNKELVQEVPAELCLLSGQAGRQETGQSWEAGSENHMDRHNDREIRLSQRLTERLSQPKANSLEL